MHSPRNGSSLRDSGNGSCGPYKSRVTRGRDAAKRERPGCGKVGENRGSGDGVVIGPGFFEAMSELFYGLNPAGVPDQKPCRRRAHATYHPERLFHVRKPFAAIRNAAHDRLDANFASVVRLGRRFPWSHGSGACGAGATLLGRWTRFDLGERWGTVHGMRQRRCRRRWTRRPLRERSGRLGGLQQRGHGLRLPGLWLRGRCRRREVCSRRRRDRSSCGAV
jgi:hypothetical protein